MGKKILYVAIKYDYGHPEQGVSFEHANFYGTLENMGYEVTYFDYLTLFHELGRDEMNRRLGGVARRLCPDLMFVCLTGDQLDYATIKAITDSGVTTTLNWFCDDHWRFEKFSARWASAFQWVTTTATCAVPKYERIGHRHVIKTQWACNHFQYQRLEMPLKYDLSFVGRVYGQRPQIIERLRSAGIRVNTRGLGWPEGRASQQEMVEIFNQSRINLNLSDSPKTLNWFKRLLGRQPPPKQIKGRNFEIPGCGGFLLTDSADNLEVYYVPGREIAIFESLSDLVEQVRYYLSHETERAQIAEAGWRRTLRDHTYERRFHEIFQRVGLIPPTSVSSAASLLPPG
jgi:spore maturation protein CgeB